MRVLIQRVLHASVSVDGETVGEIGNGLALFVGISRTDTREVVLAMCEKTANLRILDDCSRQMQCSPRTLLAEGSDIGILVVSQFTLYGDARKGRRPNYVRAAPGSTAAPMVEACVAWFQDEGFRVRTGEFGAHMLVTLANDGPVTMLLDSDEMRVPGCSESDSHG